MEVRMLALGMDRVGMESSRARRTRSVCVVALSKYEKIVRRAKIKKAHIPKWIAYDQKCNIDFVCILQNIVARRFDHLAVCDDYFTAIESFLLPNVTLISGFIPPT